MRSAVFISSGIGNAILLVPLIKALRELGHVDAISTSPFKSHEVYNGYEEDLFDSVIEMEGGVSWVKYSTRFRKPYDVVYLDYFASTRKNLTLARMLGREVRTNHIPDGYPGLLKRRIKVTEPIRDVHEGVQYLSLLDQANAGVKLSNEHYELKPKTIERKLEGDYITLQPGSGNNIAPWKCWPFDNWITVIKWISIQYPSLRMIVLGDESESEMIDQIGSIENVEILIGETSIAELPAIIGNAKLHIGQDSSMLHIAGTTRTPTVTVWGGSDPDLYGWSKIDPSKHITIHQKLDCHPCSRWIEPNTSKVEFPGMCPDFKCLQMIEPTEVQEAITEIIH